MRSRVVAGFVLVVRVVLGGLWIHEGIVKLQSHFGTADILLVVRSTAGNDRVPGFYRLFTREVVGRFPSVFGTGVPLLELVLGVALVLGLFTVPVAVFSVLELCTYWLADQLIAQYPVMAALSAVTLAGAPFAARLTLPAVLPRRVRDLRGDLGAQSRGG